VFIPILLMGDVIGRYFREFAVTLSVAILISLVASLTLTPMMCALLLRPPRQQSALVRASERWFAAMLHGYERSLAFALRHSFLTILVLAAVIGLNVHLYNTIPKGFFPQQDTGRLFGSLRADQSAPFALTQRKMESFVDIVRADPAVQKVTAVIGGGSRRSGTMFVTLKPLAERTDTAMQVVERLRRQALRVPGARLFLYPVQDVRIGGRQASSTYQYTLRSDDLELLRTWTPRLEQALLNAPELQDVDSDQETRGMQLSLIIDRPTAARYGLTPDRIDATLGNAFSQAVVSTIYRERNQYRVVMEVEEQFQRSPAALKRIYVQAPDGSTVPLSAVARYEFTNTPLSVNHQSQFAASTISFNLAEGASLSDATARINNEMVRIGMPTTIFGTFEGTARSFQRSLQYQPWLIFAAIVAVYIVLGILYESYIHPLTILSTLPSAGVGALLGLMLFDTEFGIIALIALFLLIGIVKKNAIMMVDFALAAERAEGKRPEQAIFEACRLRFRPIMMTTMAALLGALPLALGAGNGAELRTPLGIAIVGGLMLSQLLTLYTTPVVYLYLDRFRLWCARMRRPRRAGEPLEVH
jgi:multidrug efflux pump